MLKVGLAAIHSTTLPKITTMLKRDLRKKSCEKLSEYYTGLALSAPNFEMETRFVDFSPLVPINYK